MDELIERLKDLALEWEQYECSDKETNEWCDGAETATYKCAEKLFDIIEEIS